MATDVDLSAINGSLTNNTVDFTNSSDDPVKNTTQTLVTEAWTSDFLPAEKQWGWLATTVLLLATVLVNGALLGVTWKATRLHSSLYTLLGSLAFAHTLNAFLVMPMAINAAINDETEVSWSVCAAWMCLTQFIMSVVIVHLGLAILHCLVLLLSPLWYRRCTGILYPCLLTSAAWVLPLLLIIPGATVLNTTDKTNCADSLSIETIITLHIPTYYGPGITVAVIYSIVAYITQKRSRVTNQLHHEGVENAEHLNKIHRDRWSSILSNHSSMATYNSETPSICSDNASVHSIPSIDNDDGSAVTISLPNGRNGFVHLNQAPPNRLFAPNTVNGDVSAADHVQNGYVPNANAEAPRRLVANGSAVCLPDTISPATSEDDKKKQPPRDVLKQMSSDSDSMQLEIHKEDVDDDLGENDTATTQDDILRSKTDVNSNSVDSDTLNNVFHEPSDNSETVVSQNVKESVNRKLSAISERDDSSSLSVKSDESASIKGTPTHAPHPTSDTGDSPVDTTTDEESSLATVSTGSSDTQAARPTDTQLNEDNETHRSNKERGKVNGDIGTEKHDTTHRDNGDGLDVKPKSGKEQLNVPLDETEIEVSVETDKLVDSDPSASNGLDNLGFVLNDGEELSLAESIQVKHKSMDPDKTKQQSTGELIANNGEQHKDNTSSDGTQSGGHSRNSSQEGGINGPRRSILRRDRSKRQSAKSVKFDIPDTHDDNKPKRLNRKPTGKVPRNQQLRKKGSKASAKGNAATSKRRRTLVKQKAQSTEEPPSPSAAPVSNGVISSVAPYAKRPPLLSSSSSFGYMAAVQSSQAERLNHRIRAQQVNVNTLFVVFLLYVALTAPHIVLACVRSLCATCNITTEVRISLQWSMFSASLILPVVMLCFLPEYRSAIRNPKAK